MSCYNSNRELVAVLDFIEEYSYKNTHGENSVWIGLLQVDKSKQCLGLGKIIIESFVESCRLNGKQVIQIGVIRDNLKALNFWRKIGFEIFTEVNNGELDLYLMEKEIKS